jgi:hypothetical protein
MLYLSEMKSFALAVKIYRACLIRIGASDPNSTAILDFANDRGTSLKTLEAELQPLEDLLFSFFKSVLPALQLALGASATFPWRTLNICDKPEVNLPSELFFRPNYVVFMHLSDVVDGFLLFGALFVHRLQDAAIALDTWLLAYKYSSHVHLYGSANVEVKPIVLAMKGYKKLSGLDVSFLDGADSGLSRHRANQSLKWHWLALLLRDYVAACQIDASTICAEWGLGLSLLGFASFELCNAFKMHQSRPSPEKAGGKQWDPRDLVELLFHFVKLNGVISKNIADLRRFIVYNLREFDAPFLDTVVHSYLLPPELVTSLETLREALQQIDIEDYDRGTPLDLGRCLSVVESTTVDFNAYGVSHGVSHLTTLMQLLSGLSLRLTLYEDGFLGWLRVSKLHQFWQYIDCLSIIIGRHSTDATAHFHVTVIHAYHFFAFDEPAIAEVGGLSATIHAAYESGLAAVAQTVFNWFKSLQDSLVQLSPGEIAAGDPGHVQRLRSADRHLQKATFTLAELGELGTIQVIGTDHTCALEVADQVEGMVANLFLKTKNVYPPAELQRRLDAAKWSFQQICAAARVNFCQAIARNVGDLAAADDRAASLALAYRDHYVQLARDVLPGAYFSNTQQTFVAVNAKLGAPSAFTSLAALQALRDVIGGPGCCLIHRALAQLACQIAGELCAAFGRLLAGRSAVWDSGVLQVQDPGVLIGRLGHVCAVLRLREMVRPFADAPKLAPHEDTDVVGVLQAPMKELINNPSTVQLFATLFANSYWESFNYDIAHDAARDNSHLWAWFFDIFVACAANAGTQITPDLFYRQLFLQSISSIHKASAQGGKRRGQYQGLELLILLDHIVSESRYANYSQLEQYVSYQFIRSLYTARLSRIGK